MQQTLPRLALLSALGKGDKGKGVGELERVWACLQGWRNDLYSFGDAEGGACSARLYFLSPLSLLDRHTEYASTEMSQGGGRRGRCSDANAVSNWNALPVANTRH